MSYTSDERDAAVSGLVKGTLSFSRDRLGPRDVKSSFGEVQELVNTTLLYEPDAIFYLVYLASNRLRRLVQAELDTIDELLDAVDDLLKPNKPVEDISGAADAEAALIALEGAMSRKGAVSSQEYSRYTSAVRRLTRELGRTTKHTFVPRGSSQAVTDIVRPEAQAKRDVRTHMDALVDDHAAMLAGVNRILSAFDNFVATDLGATVAQRQVSRAREKMTDLKERLEVLTPGGRIEEARSALLEVLANKSVVKEAAQAPTPGDKKVYQRLGAAAKYRATAAGEGTAPAVVGTFSAPFRLSSTAKNLALEMNGGAAQEFDLLPSSSPSYQTGIQSAQLTGGIPGPYVIRGEDATPGPLITGDTTTSYGLTAFVDNLLHIIVDGVQYEVALYTFTSGTPTEVAQAINDEPGLKDVVTASVVPGRVSGDRVEIDYDYTVPANMPKSYSDRYMAIVPGMNSAHTKLKGLTQWRVNPSDTDAGTDSPRVSGWDGNNRLRVKANDTTTYVDVQLPVGSYPDYEVTAAAVRSAITTYGGTQFGGGGSGEYVLIGSAKKGEGSIITMLSAGTLSGDREGIASWSLAGLRTLGFFEHQEDRQRDIDGRIVTNLLTTSANFKNEATAKMERTEYLNARQATKQAAGSDPTHVKMDVPLESNPLGSWPDAGELKLEVNNGDNRGIYEINSLTWDTDHLVVEVKNRNFRDIDTSYLYNLVIYRDRLVITSKDKSTSGALEVVTPSGNDARAVLGLPTGQVSSTVAKVLVEYNDPAKGWKPLDLRALRVRQDDDLVREDTATTLTSVSSVADGRNGLIGVEPEVASDLSLTTAQGFFILSAAAQSHDSFVQRVSQWKKLTLPPYQDNVAAIDRLLSPILSIKSSSQRVDQAYNTINELRARLDGSGSLMEIVESFSVPMINDVEDILQALKERGYDKALEMLVTGDPATFTTMEARDASFGRSVMKAMSEITVQDINESTARGSQFEDVHQRLRAEIYDDKNPINDFSDMEMNEGDPEALDLWTGLED